MDLGVLQRLVECGERAWPGVKLTPQAFSIHLRAVLPATTDPATLPTLHGEDLYLAAACALGNTRAIAAFEETYLPQVSGYIASIGRDPAFVDEVRQQLREKLLVQSEEGRPKICEYTGRGPLGAWLRVVCVRLALNLKRRGKTTLEPEGEHGPTLRSPSPDPELDYLKTRYGEEFRAAFLATMAALTSDERNLLKLHYLDGLNIDEIGVAYRVHRATVARWLAHSRDKILAETRRRLTERLGAETSEVDSLLDLCRSRLDVSIGKVLKS
jgi:RNA polymerase sigma-70 factor (ECF subfamily)